MRALLARLMAVVGLVAGLGVAVAGPASASSTDCFSYAYACTPGYSGSNASGTWAWSHFGAPYANTPNGIHNCTLYAAWRVEQSGLTKDPGNWGNASTWAARIGGGNHTPAVGSIAWYAGTKSNPAGHVAYVEQVSGANVYIRADNYSTTKGYTDAGWVAASSVGLFLHPHDVAAGSGSKTNNLIAFQANTGNLYQFSSQYGPANLGQGMMSGTSPAVTALPGGGYEMAFQANTGALYAFGDAGSYNTGQGMMAGTSPSIAASPNGGFLIAFQANTGNLYQFSSQYGPANLGQGMMRGTSPAAA